MTGLAMWLRRSSVARAFPGLLAMDLILLMLGGGWGYEWNWAFSKASTPTILLSPLLAGLVAFDRSRRFTSTLQSLSETVARPRVTVIGVAGWLWSCLVWCVGVACAGVVAKHGGASGRPDLWVFVQTPFALLAAASVGLAWGARMRGPLAGPAAAVVIYVVTIVAKGLGLPGVFCSGGATGSLIGVTQVPSTAAASVGINLAIALTALLWHEEARLLHRRGIRTTAVVLTVITICGAVGIARQLGGRDTYQAVGGRPVCVGEGVVVCGPSDGRAVLMIAQSSLEKATRRLAPSGLPWRQRYLMSSEPDDLAAADDAGKLNVKTEDIRDGELSQTDIASTLTMPRLCQAFLGEHASDELLLSSQLVLRSWVTAALHQPGPPRPAPRNVVAASTPWPTAPHFGQHRSDPHDRTCPSLAPRNGCGPHVRSGRMART